MSHSGCLKLGDVRAIFRLVGEVRELGADPMLWRRHLVERLIRLVGGKVCLAIESGPFLADRLPAILGMVDIGWADAGERGKFLDYLSTLKVTEIPYWSRYAEFMTSRRSFTVSRTRWVSDRDWYGSRHVNESRRGCVDDFVYSVVNLPHLGGAHSIAIHRDWGEPRFGNVQRRMIRLLHQELADFWTPSAPEAAAGPFADLSPRCAQTLACLLGGDSEKEAARKLGISRHTIHHYVVDLHRHFGVSTRGELLARCREAYAPRVDFRPRLLLAAGPVG